MADKRDVWQEETKRNNNNNNGHSINGGSSGGPSRGGMSLSRAQRGGRAHQHQQQGGQHPAYPIAWKIIEELNAKVIAKDILEGSSDLLDQMNQKPVFRRMDDIWAEADKQQVFLHLCLLTARTNQESIRQRTQDFLRDMLNSKLVDTMVKRHFAPFRPQLPHVAEIAHSLIGLLLLGWQTFPSLMLREMTIHTDQIVAKMEMANNGAQFPPKETKDVLDRLKVIKQDHENKQIERDDSVRMNKNVGGGRRVYDSSGPPPQDFREIVVSLSSDDILVENSQIYLRKAHINGQPYDNDDHYLDVQFRLLREDLVRPLRNGIHQFRLVGNDRRAKLDLYVYRDVRLICTQLRKQDGEILTYAQLGPKNSGRRMHRRFMFGSLVCLSSDAFQQQFLFATVIDRDALEGNKRHQPEKGQQNIRNGTIGLKFLSTMDRPDMNVTYFLVESPVFYESHRHVLSALKNFKPGDAVPFSRHFVRMERDPEIPRYQRDGRMFNFNSLLVNPPRHGVTQCTTAQLFTHFTAAAFGMDDSQFDAFAYALRSELAVVQGPPGTGKTYLGLKIVQLLFDNEQLWAANQQRREYTITLNIRQLRSPMLVVCYTNHALDQFLEGIANFLQDGIVRVGGQSKSEKLEKYNLNNLRQKGKEFLSHDRRKAFFECSTELNKMAIDIEKNEKALAQTNNNNQGLWIVRFNQLEGVVLDKQPWAMAKFYFTDNREMDRWLTEAQAPQNNEPRMDLHLLLQLVHQYGWQEDWAKGVLIYSACNDSHELLERIANNNSKSAKGKLMMWLANEQCRQVYQNVLNSWPTLAEVDMLSKQLGLDVELVAYLLHGLKRDQQQRAEHIASIRQHILAIPIHIRRRARNEGQIGLVEGGGEIQGQEQFDENEHWEEAYEDKAEENRKLAIDQDDDLFKVEQQPVNFEEHIFTNWLKSTKGIRQLIAAIQPMDETEAIQYHGWREDPWKLPLLTRWRLYQRWVQEWREKQIPKQEELMREYCVTKRRYDELRSQSDIELMKRAKVIGMTTTGAARLQAALRSIKPRIVVVEEAAEVYEQHILTSLTECCEHLILIGDHQQLRPSPEDYRLGKDYHLEISLFERLVLNEFQFRRLSNQHRMRPEISGTLMPHFYANLQDHPSVHEYPDVLGVGKNLFFLNHSHPEDVKGGMHQQSDSAAKSHCNEFEAMFAVRFAKYLSQQGYENSKITILCTYSDQFFLIRNLMQQMFPVEHKQQKNVNGKGEDGHPISNNRIRVENVDNYQGEECDIIILSLVRSNNPQRKIGFLNIPNRVCVAMSRAKHGFYVLGNFDFLAEGCATSRQTPTLWTDIRRSAMNGGFLGTALPICCQMHSKKQEIRCVQDFDLKAPEGGCCQPCSTRMICGHTCRKPCHAYDPQHTKMKCMEKCQRKCANELHKCQKICYQKCGLCLVKIVKELPCGHSKIAECHLDPLEVVCPKPCHHVLSCGHQCAEKCNQPHTVQCQELVSKQLHCGHNWRMSCYRSPETFKCPAKVKKIWPICGHSVETECWVNPEETLCPHPCRVPLPDCSDLCVGTCGKCRGGRLHVECNMDCKRILICGHECRKKCTEECPPCQEYCETACAHSQCCMALPGEQNKKTRMQYGKKQQGRKCGDPCPPCAKKCTNKCQHRECAMTCGEKCDVEPCNEPCRRALPCSPNEELKEGQEGPLPEPHYCIGVCGEDCIKDICRICQPDKFEELREIFFGHEDEEDALFVRLKDCGHIFEMQGLDTEIKTQVNGGEAAEGGADRAITVIKCPRCSTPIKRSKRYIALLNERAGQIDQVKRKLQGHRPKLQLVEVWRKFKEANFESEQLDHLLDVYLALDEEKHFMSAMKGDWQQILDALGKIQDSEVTAQWMNTAENIKRILAGFSEELVRIGECRFLSVIVKEQSLVPTGTTNTPPPTAQISPFHALITVFRRFIVGQEHLVVATTSTSQFGRLHSALAAIIGVKQQSLREFLLEDLASLLHSLVERKLRTISATSLQQLASELGRNNFLFNVFKWAGTMEIEQQMDVDMEAANMLRSLLSKVAVDRKPFAEQQGDFETEFKALTAHFNIPGMVGISKTEFIQIKQALSSNLGRWYTCPNGHVYSIGQCGGVMERSKCPECNEIIGEGQHRLLKTNAEARQLNAEFDAALKYDPFEARW